jgi:hypothetical protein
MAVSKKATTTRQAGPGKVPARTQQARRAAAAPATPVRLQREPKGRRAQFYEATGVDQLMGIVTALTAEVSVAFERLDTLERLLERAGSLQRSDVEAYLPDPAAAAERFRKREELIQRVFQVLGQYGRQG